jgi:hypothetical protein
MDSKLQRAPAQDRDSRPRTAGETIVVVSPKRPADEVEFGSGWYHEAAIAESQQAHVRHR